MRRPTRTERDNAAAWSAYQSRISQQIEVALRVFLATVVGVLLTLALLHWATPCAEAALCLLPAALPGRLGAWWRCRCRRLHMQLLRTRLLQLLGTAQAMAMDTRPDGALRLGAVLARAAALRLDLERLERADAHERRLRRLQA